MRQLTTSSDQLLALRALVEGDASLVGFLYSATFFQDFSSWIRFLQKRADRLFAIEGVASYSLARAQFPYLLGSLFVARIHQKKGFAGVDALFLNPPPSTEVILHPELLERPEGRVRSVVLPQVPHDPGWPKVVAEDTLGEHGLRMVLARNAPLVDSVSAAAGWGGDRFRVVQDTSGQLGLLWSTRWDSDKDAAEFCRAYRRLLALSYDIEAKRFSPHLDRFERETETLALLRCQGQAVDIVETLGAGRMEWAIEAMRAVEEAQN